MTAPDSPGRLVSLICFLTGNRSEFPVEDIYAVEADVKHTYVGKFIEQPTIWRHSGENLFR